MNCLYAIINAGAMLVKVSLVIATFAVVSFVVLSI